MKFCGECGKVLEDDAVFCPQCGTRWEKAAPEMEAESQPDRIYSRETENTVMMPVQGPADDTEYAPARNVADAAEYAPADEAEYAPAQERAMEPEYQNIRCSQCGAVVEADAVFCGECGARLDIGSGKDMHPAWDQVREASAQAASTEEPQAQGREPWTPQAQAQKSQAQVQGPGPVVFCPECGAKNDEGGDFCIECGARLNPEPVQVEVKPKQEKKEKKTRMGAGAPEMLFCPECGTQNEPGSDFCLNCGASLKPDKKKTFGKKLTVGVAAVAAVAVIGIGVSFVPKLLGGKAGGSAGANMLVYYKEGSSYQYGLKNGKSLELTDRTLDDLSENIDEYEYSSALDTAYTSDGKYVFYYEKYDADTGSGSLYVRSAKKEKDEAEKVDSDVWSFNVTDKDNIFYKKRDGDNLYQYDIKKKDKEKIASDVTEWHMNEAEDKVIWTTSEGVLYVKELKKDGEKEKLDSDVTGSVYASEDLNSIYYRKEDTLYTLKNLKDKEKLSSEAYIVGYYKDSGIYYTKPAKKEIGLTAAEFVDDDMAEADRNMQEPLESNYSTAVQTWAGTRNKVDYDAFNAARDAYQQKQARDSLRTQLKEETLLDDTAELFDLYVYDGKDSTSIANAVYNTYTYGEAEVFISMENLEPVKVVKMSQISSLLDIESMDMNIEDLFSNDFTGWMLGNDAYASMTIDPEAYTKLDKKNNVLYLATKDGDSFDTLYKYGFSSGKTVEEKLDDDIEEASFSYSTISSGDNAGLYYFKDLNEEKTSGTLYRDGKKVEDDVYMSYFSFSIRGDDVYALTDYSSKDNCGTLTKVGGGKSEKLADDVAAYHAYKGGTVVYLRDFGQKRLKGDLYLWKGNKEEKIDEDVTYFSGQRNAYELYQNLY